MFKPIDRELSRSILGCLEGETVEALAYLFAATRLGYSCVCVEKKALYPNPSQILDEEVDPSFSERVMQGFACLPNHILQDGQQEGSLRPVVKVDEAYYFQKYYFLEKNIAASIAKQLLSTPKDNFSEEEIEKTLLSYSSYLTQEQRKAIHICLQKRLVALTGGPGTGKTYTVEYLLRVYLELCLNLNKTPKILVMAPTGKAVALVKHKLAALSSSCHLVISTMHSALGIKRQASVHQSKVLPYDFILVDESSMIDSYLWKALLSSLQEGSRLIVMGDPYQLPPVESGMVFKELIFTIPHVELTQSMRTGQSTLIALAKAVKEGDALSMWKLFLQDPSICYREYDQEKELTSISLLEPYMYREFTHKEFCFLSPVLEGLWGVNILNQKMYEQQALLKRKKALPVIVTRNDYQQELYNGDIGLLVEEKNPMHSYVIFAEGRKVEKALMPPYSYAYALSVHKSQGSEYDDIVLFLPEGSQYFGREILYTAITRAKKSLTVIAKRGVVTKCLERSCAQNNSLVRFLP